MYWQQQANYSFNVELEFWCEFNLVQRLLKKFTYINNSPINWLTYGYSWKKNSAWTRFCHSKIPRRAPSILGLTLRTQRGLSGRMMIFGYSIGGKRLLRVTIPVTVNFKPWLRNSTFLRHWKLGEKKFRIRSRNGHFQYHQSCWLYLWSSWLWVFLKAMGKLPLYLQKVSRMAGLLRLFGRAGKKQAIHGFRRWELR